jgi:hypothetical protein
MKNFLAEVSQSSSIFEPLISPNRV